MQTAMTTRSYEREGRIIGGMHCNAVAAIGFYHERKTFCAFIWPFHGSTYKKVVIAGRYDMIVSCCSFHVCITSLALQCP